MALFGSRLLRPLVAALTQAGATGLTLRELASATRSAETTLRHTLQVLVREGLAERSSPRRGPRYRLSAGERAEALTRLVFAERPGARLAEAVVRANPGVEFAAVERGRDPALFVVYREDADPADELRLERALERLALPARAARHDDFIARTLEEEGLRERVVAARVVKGRLARSLPDRRAHGDLGARRLGRPHPRLRRPARRRLRDIARRHGIRRISLFGSAVRQDFRADSDVDVLVDYARPPSLRDLVELELELERLFDRDVDIVRESDLAPRVRRQALAEAVPIVG